MFDFVEDTFGHENIAFPDGRNRETGTIHPRKVRILIEKTKVTNLIEKNDARIVHVYSIFFVTYVPCSLRCPCLAH